MLKRGLSRLLLSPQASHNSLKATSLPIFLLPTWYRSFNSTPQIIDGSAIPESLRTSEPTTNTSLPSKTPQISSLSFQPASTSSNPPSSSPEPFEPSNPETHETLDTLLPLLRAQAPHYITVLIHNRPYLVTAGDKIRLPFFMPDVVPGDILRLTRASNLGSRDFTLKGAPYVDERLFECRARVMGVEAEPMRIKEKTKRRQRRVKTVKSKHKYTILRIAELNVVGGEEATP